MLSGGLIRSSTNRQETSKPPRAGVLPSSTRLVMDVSDNGQGTATRQTQPKIGKWVEAGTASFRIQQKTESFGLRPEVSLGKSQGSHLETIPRKHVLPSTTNRHSIIPTARSMDTLHGESILTKTVLSGPHCLVAAISPNLIETSVRFSTAPRLPANIVLKDGPCMPHRDLK